MIKYKRLNPETPTPVRATEGAGAVDLTAVSMEKTDMYIEYGTGIAVEIPEGHLGICAARSSVTKKDLMLGNGVGFIDSDYRGEIKFRFKYLENGEYYNIGDRIGQLTIVPINNQPWEEVTELSSTQRGSGGYGSTGQ